jgi:hypothetical protein
MLSLFTSHAESVASPTSAALLSVHARSMRIGSRTHAVALGVVAVAAMALTPAFATAPNTTAAASVPYEVGQGWVTHYFDENVQTRWFRFGEVGGHSYCIEAVQGSVSPVLLDPNLAIFTNISGTTPLSIAGNPLTNNDGGNNPNLIRGSRICYIAPTAFGVVSERSVRLAVPIAASSGDAGNLRLRVVDTTLVGPPSTFYYQETYLHYYTRVVVHNHTAQAITATLSIPFGSHTHTQTFSVAAYNYLGAGPNIAPSTVYTGLTYIAHTGSPGSVKAIHTQYTTSYPFNSATSSYVEETKHENSEMKTKN